MSPTALPDRSQLLPTEVLPTEAAAPTTAAPPTTAPQPRRARTFASLSVPNYRLYLTGQIVSLCGTWMQVIALGWLVLRLGASGTVLGLVSAAQFLPMLLFGAYGGLIADRADKRTLLIGTQAVSGSLALLLGTLDLTGAVRLWMVAAVAVALGAVNAIDIPTRQSFVHELVGPETLTNAVTLNTVSMNAARVVGPALAGIVVATSGTGVCFLINAASFLASIVAIQRTDPSKLTRRAPVARQRGQVRAGVAYVARTPALRVPILMMALIGTLTYEFQVSLPLIARQTFTGTAATYGTMTAAMGAGAVVGGLLAARRRTARPAVVVRAAGAFGATVLVAAVSPTLPLVVVALVAVGAASVLFMSSANASVQLAADPAMRGRVMALWSVAFLGSTPVGAPVVGFVAQALGPRAGLALGGVAALVACASGAGALRSRRRPDAMRPDAARRLDAARGPDAEPSATTDASAISAPRPATA